MRIINMIYDSPSPDKNRKETLLYEKWKLIKL